MKLIAVSGVFFFLLFLSSVAVAAEGIVLEVQITESSKENISARVKFTGNGNRPADEETSIIIQESRFGSEGVSRIETLLVSALLSGNPVWFQLDGSSNIARGVFLKAK